MFFTDTKKTKFTLYPLLWLAACFTIGILVAGFFAFGWPLFLAGCLFSAGLSVIFIKRPLRALIFLSGAFLAGGGMCFQIETQSISADRLKILYDTARINSGDPIEVEGVLASEPESAVSGVFLLLKAEKAIYKGQTLSVSGNIRLFASFRNEPKIANEYAQIDLRYGSRIRVGCNLQRRDDFLNPGVASRKQILDRQNIDAAGIIKSPLLIEKISDTESFAPLALLYKFRRELINDLRENFNNESAGILIASLLGNRHYLNKQTADLFREGGTFHALVISGLHITFIGGLTLLLVRFFTNRRFLQFLLASAFLWSYSLAVGAEVPVVRAALMFTILLFSRVIYRRGTLLNALGACVLILLIWRPADVYNPSFQLTLVSVAAIIATAFPLIENLRAIGSWSPTAEKPFPPNVPVWLKRFCETLYWREKVWERDSGRHIWSARLFKSPYLKWFAERNLQGILRYLFEGILVSLIVQIWLMPLLVVYFHRLSLFAVLLNLWVEISIVLAGFTAFAAILLAQLSSGLALPFIKLTEFLNWFLLSVPQVLVENDLASSRLPVYAGKMQAVYFLYFAPLLVLTLLLNYWKPFSLNFRPRISNFKFSASVSVSGFILLLALIVFHPFSEPALDGRLHVDFLDVGQGDATLIRFPNGETMLIDGGGKMNFNKIYQPDEVDGEEPEIFEPDTPTIGEAVVSEFLWEKGFSQIDYILATHADTDHIQGLVDIAKNFRVRKALFGRAPFEDEDFASLFSILEKRGVDRAIISRGEILNFGDVRVEVLYPEKDDSPEAVSDNNHSIVLRIAYGSRKFLLTGDIERETEELLVKNSVLEADLVKVAHHGSRTSSTAGFIEATKAVYAIIPVGRESPFGHPNREVVGRWQNAGAKILTTGMRGTVSVSTDGKDLRLETFVK